MHLQTPNPSQSDGGEPTRWTEQILRLERLQKLVSRGANGPNVWEAIYSPGEVQALRAKYSSERRKRATKRLSAAWLAQSFEAIHGGQKAAELYRVCGRKDALEFFEIQLSVQLAREITMFKHLGLFDALKTNNRAEAVLAILRVKGHRRLSHPDILDFITAAAREDDHTFFIRLGKVLSQPAEDYSHFVGDRRERFLLRFWDEPYEKDGQIVPPLAYFTERALGEFVNLGFQSANLCTTPSIRKTWIRLGLKKAARPLIRKVSLRGRTLRFDT